MAEPLYHDEHVHKDVEEHRVVEPVEEHRIIERTVVEPVEEHRVVERRVIERERDSMLAIAAIRYTAIVIIVLAILYFLAVFVIPAVTGR